MTLGGGVWTIAAGWSVLFLIRRGTKTRRSPQAEGILRPPGHTLSEELNKIDEKGFERVLVLFGAGVVGFGGIWELWLVGRWTWMLRSSLAEEQRADWLWIAISRGLLPAVAIDTTVALSGLGTEYQT